MRSDIDEYLATIDVPGDSLTPPRPGTMYRVYVFRRDNTLTLEVGQLGPLFPSAESIRAPGKVRIESGNATMVLDVLRALTERLDQRSELRDMLDNPEHWSAEDFRQW